MRVIHHKDTAREIVIIRLEVGQEPNGSRWFRTYEGQVIPVAIGEEPPIYLRLPFEVARAIGVDIDGEAADIASNADAVRDARETRDKLLALVERLVQPPVMTGFDNRLYAERDVPPKL